MGEALYRAIAEVALKERRPVSVTARLLIAASLAQFRERGGRALLETAALLEEPKAGRLVFLPPAR